MVRSEFMAAINAVASDRGIEPEVVLETLRHALIAAYRKDYGDPEELDVAIDSETGEITVLDGVKDITPAGFGRIAAQTAKQVILQGVREAEKEAIISDFRDRVDTVVSGMLQRREGRHWFVDIGRTIAFMPVEEQVMAEEYHQNMRFKVLVKDIRSFRGREMVIVSRSDSELVRGLFAMEVPEVTSGAVELKAIAREAGQRSKVAVYTSQDGVDPIGSAVGQRGVRVQAITDELLGEKIDIVLWDPSINRFIVAALSPAKVLSIETDPETKEAVVVVPEDQLSLAIGKGGQNVRLAAKLTGYRIDLRSEEESSVSVMTTEVTEDFSAETERDPFGVAVNELSGLEDIGLSENVVSLLQEAGYDSVEKLHAASDDELLEIKGVGPKAVEDIRGRVSA